MPTIVDSLIVTLGLDGRGFNRGRQQATGDLNAMKADARRTEDEIVKIKTNSTKATKAQDDIQIKSLRAVLDAKRRSIRDVQSAQKDELSATKNQSEAVGALRGQLIGMLALFTAGAGIKSFVTSTVSAETATGRLAANLGISTEALSTFEAISRRVGGTAAEGAAGLQALVSAYQEFRLTGSTGHDQDFNALGISAQTLSDPVATMEAFAAAAERMSKPEFAARMSRIGLSPGLINALELGRKGFADVYVEASRFAAISQRDAQSGERLTETLNNVGDAGSSLGRDLLTGAEPGLEAVGRALVGLSGWARNNEPVVAGAFIGIAGALGVLTVALIVATAPISGIVIALAGIGALAGAAYAQIKATIALIAGTPAEKAAQTAKDMKAYGGPINAVRKFLGLKPWPEPPADAATTVPPRAAAPTPAVPNPVGAAPTPAGNASDEAYFRSRGFSPQAAAGIAAGIQAESGGDPNAVNPKSGAFGLGQHLGRRKQMLFERYGTAPTRAQQLEYIAWELSHTEAGAGQAIAAAPTAKAALATYINQFERPKAGPETTGDLRRGGAYLASAGAGVITTAQAAAGASSVVNNGPVTTTTTINGGINIATAATDAKGIAGAIGPAIRQRGLAFQANSGLG